MCGETDTRKPMFGVPGPLGANLGDLRVWGVGGPCGSFPFVLWPQKQLQPTTPNEFRDHHRNLEIVELPKSIPNFKVDFFKL